MKKIVFISLLFLLFSCKIENSVMSYGDKKQDLNILDKRLRQIESIPYIPELSGDSIFWVIVKDGKPALPLLIEKISDTTQTNVSIPNFGGNYTIGDMANAIIQKIIINVPILSFVEGELSNGYGNYWSFIRKDYANRLIYQKRILNWYNHNKSDLVWVDDNSEYKTSQTWKFSDNKHPARGYFRVEQ